MDCFCFFPHPSPWPVWKVRFGPPNFNRGLRFHGDLTETKLPIFTIFIKNINFFTDQDMIEAIAQNCAKTKAPTKKLIKSTLKYTDRGAFSTYWLWFRCSGSARNLAAKIVKICVFWKFWKNEKWLTLNRKISVTKVWK